MKRLAYVLILVLAAVVAVQSVMLIRARRDVNRLTSSEKHRAMFCGTYRTIIWTTREQMERDSSARDPSFGYLFYNLTTEPFLDACRVPDPTRAMIARREGWNCKTGAAGEDDYPCLARIARELEAAIPHDSE